MGLEAIYPKPPVTIVEEMQQKYPYLLPNIPIERVNQVWSPDITYIHLDRNHIYVTNCYTFERIDQSLDYPTPYPVYLRYATSIPLSRIIWILFLGKRRQSLQLLQFQSAYFCFEMGRKSIFSWDSLELFGV